MNLEGLTVAGLLEAHAAILDELRRREVIRSANNPVSDLAEVLFCRAFKWTMLSNSAAGYDATDANDARYQIKGRRQARVRPSRQLSAIRNLGNDPFDYLAGVLFNSDYTVMRAAIIPLGVVKGQSTRQEHTNSWRFLLHDKIWMHPAVRDVTAELRACSSSL